MNHEEANPCSLYKSRSHCTRECHNLHPQPGFSQWQDLNSFLICLLGWADGLKKGCQGLESPSPAADHGRQCPTFLES